MRSPFHGVLGFGVNDGCLPSICSIPDIPLRTYDISICFDICFYGTYVCNLYLFVQSNYTSPTSLCVPQQNDMDLFNRKLSQPVTYPGFAPSPGASFLAQFNSSEWNQSGGSSETGGNDRLYGFDSRSGGSQSQVCFTFCLCSKAQLSL